MLQNCLSRVLNSRYGLEAVSLLFSGFADRAWIVTQARFELCSFLHIPLLRLDCQTVDIKICTNLVNDSDSPAHISCNSKGEVTSQVPGFYHRIDLFITESWQVANQSSNHQRQKHDCPVWERLPGEVMENDLRRQPTEDERGCQAEQNQMVFREQTRIR